MPLAFVSCLLPLAFVSCLLHLSLCLLPFAFVSCLLPLASCLLHLSLASCLLHLPLAFCICAIPKGWFPHCSAFSSLNSCGPFNDPIRCHHGPKEGPLRAFGLPDGGPRLKVVPPKSSVAAHPPGGDPGKDQHLDLWEVLSPWNPALLKATDRGIDRSLY